MVLERVPDRLDEVVARPGAVLDARSGPLVLEIGVLYSVGADDGLRVIRQPKRPQR